jgi:hypothetical protein
MLDRHDSSSVDVVVVEDLEVDDSQRLSIAFDDFVVFADDAFEESTSSVEHDVRVFVVLIFILLVFVIFVFLFILVLIGALNKRKAE